MGLYDREYYREERRGFSLGGDRSMVTNLILVNVAVYVLDLLFDGGISDYCSLRPDLLQHPWNAWQLLTAGFIHARDVRHILFNMLVLFFFGRDIEGIYGRSEFLRIYLCLIVLSSLSWAIAQGALDANNSRMMGASGAVMGIVMLYALHFPRRLIYVWGVLPVPAWAMASATIAIDVFGVTSNNDHVAHSAHLAGAFFGWLYWYSGINLGRFLPSGARWPGFGVRPRLRVHDARDDVHDSLDKRVDHILDKVSQQGIGSLTNDERQLLEDASRRYQRRRS